MWRTRRSSIALNISCLPLLLALASGCSSRDERAVAAASVAATALEQKNYAWATINIQKALALRDDVSDYWLLLGRINLASNKPGAAYAAYQNVIQLNRSSIEALTYLCQLGLGADDPDQVDRNCDQLLLLTPDDPTALAMKGGAALLRGDEAPAMALAERALAINPTSVAALLLKARVLAAEGKLAEATKLIEASLGKDGDPTPRLALLQRLYAIAGDRANFERTTERLAALHPEAKDRQLAYADLLYDRGDIAGAYGIVRKLMRARPGDAGLAASILDLWLRQGPSALPADRMLADARVSSLEMQAAYAQFANATGRADLALSILGTGWLAGPPSAAAADAIAARAQALGLRGNRAEALAALDRLLATDARHPAALIARARMRAAGGNVPGAIADVRRVVADDPRNAPACILLADLLLARGDRLLALSALRTGIEAAPAEPRLADRLAAVLLAGGEPDRAKAVLSDLTSAAPVSRRAWQLRARLCERLGDEPCVAIARSALRGEPAYPSAG